MLTILSKITTLKEGTPTRENLLYIGNSIAQNGIVTMRSPADEDFYSPLTGVSFKLAGDFKKAGYDSVYMPIGSADKNFKLSDRQLKNVGFIIGADIASEKSNYVTVSLNYKDGTSEEKEVKVYGPNTTIGLSENAYLQISTVAKYDPQTNTYVSGAADNIAAMKVVPSYVIPDATKNVSSITFKSDADFNYSIIAITEIPYTNDELFNAFDTLFFDYEPSDINEENAQDVMELCMMSYEAARRNVITEADSLDVNEYYIVAYDILNAELSFETVITTDDKNAVANVTMTNTTSKPQPYQLVIVAYDVDGRVAGINFSEEKTLETDKENITDSVSIGIISGATYKAFVWSGFDTMIPLAN